KQLLCVSAFDSLRGAAGAVAGIAASRVVPAALEVVDKSWIEANPVLKEFGQTDVLLFIELDGCAGAIKRESETVAAICRRTGASFLRRISREKKIEEWRESRRALDRFSRTGLVSGMKSVVPLPKMVDVLAGLRTIGERHGLAVLAHGYCLLNDFHAEVAVQPAEEEKVERLVSEILELADSLGGSASGPHGARAPRRSPDRVCLAIKRALDPNGIVNPLRRHHKRVVHC
ncbi:MAG: FAD-binding oxidoreductase, partial [bacterium]